MKYSSATSRRAGCSTTWRTSTRNWPVGKPRSPTSAFTAHAPRTSGRSRPRGAARPDPCRADHAKAAMGADLEAPRKDFVMSTIGTFTASGNGYTGTMRTLTLNLKLRFVPNAEKERDNAPVPPRWPGHRRHSRHGADPALVGVVPRSDRSLSRICNSIQRRRLSDRVGLVRLL